MLIKMYCYRCGTETEVDGKPFRRDECPKCSSYLHCCMNCKLYDPLAYQECHEPMATWVEDKEMANLCGYFKAITEPKKDTGVTRKDAARAKLQQLFGKKPEPDAD